MHNCLYVVMLKYILQSFSVAYIRLNENCFRDNSSAVSLFQIINDNRLMSLTYQFLS